MLNKSYLGTGLSVILSLQSVYAGTMGDVRVFQPSSTPFASLEGSLTWIWRGHDSGQLSVSTPVLSSTHTTTKTDTNIGGGRLAGGSAYHYTDSFDLIGEAGLNYFGDFTVRVANSGASQPVNLKLHGTATGVDFLMGASYKFQELHQVEWFGKVGALFVNTKVNTSLATLPVLSIAGATYSFGGISHTSSLNVLPEIKVGATYNCTERLGISLSYMHAFGTNQLPRVIGTLNQSNTGTFVLNTVAYARTPSLNAALLGLKYSFV
jgi:hypothetical protein